MSNGANQDFFPWDENAANDDWAAGVYRVRVIHAEDGASQSSGKRMLRVGYQCLEPTEYAMMSHFENYTVGTDEAPNDVVKGTMGFRNLMKLCKAAQVPQANSVQALLASLRDAECLISMSYKPDADFKNNINNYFRLGERPVGVSGKGPQPGASKAAPGQPPMAPPTAPPPGQVPFMQPAPAMPPPPTQQPLPTPSAPPTALQASTPPAQPAPPASGIGPAAAGTEPVVNCTICGTQVPYSQFSQHIQAHAAQMKA